MRDSLITELKQNIRSRHQVIDYHNAKYQGMADSIPINRNGTGIVLDHNYMLALALWKNGKVDGESLIIYPDNQIFYGEIKSKYPIGIGCYQISKKCKILSSLGKGQDEQFVFNDCKSTSLIFITVNRQIMKQLSEQRTADQDILKKLYIKNEQQIRIRQEDNLKTIEQKWNAIQKFLSLPIKKQLRDYKSFMKCYFSKQESKIQNCLQISQGKDEFQFKFKNSSIFCKITEGKGNQLDYKLKSLGFYDSFTQSMDICKKYNLNRTVEENVQGNAIGYEQTPFKRPQECLKRLHRYYKQSLNFVDQFIEVDYLYRIKFIFRNISGFIQHYSTNNQAQRLLQNPTFSISQQNRKQQEAFLPIQLHEVKEDIYKAVQKKSLSKNKSFSQNKYNQDQKITSLYEQPSYKFKDDIRQDHTDFTSPHKKQQRYLQEQSSLSRSNKQRARRSYVYLQGNRQQTYEKQKMANRYRNSPEKDSARPISMKRQNRANLSKYVYLQDRTIAKKYDANQQKLQNLRALTSYYEEVQSELRRQTPAQTPSQPKKRKVSGTIQKNQRSPIVEYTNYPNLQHKKSFERQIQTPSLNSLPLGPRKVLKYV